MSELDPNPMCTFVFHNKEPVRKRFYDYPAMDEYTAYIIIADDGRIFKNRYADIAAAKWEQSPEPRLQTI